MIVIRKETSKVLDNLHVGYTSSNIPFGCFFKLGKTYSVYSGIGESILYRQGIKTIKQAKLAMYELVMDTKI